MSEAERSAAIRLLMGMDAEVVSARLIAPVLKMDPGVIVHYAKTGQWDQDALGKFVISGNRVKFFRKDFLQKCGFIAPDPPEKTDSDRLDELIELIRVQNAMLMEICACMKKTAGVAAPTE